MRKLIFLVIILLSNSTFSQLDSIKSNEDSRLKVMGRVIKNNIFNVPSDFSEMGRIVSNDWKETATYAGGIIGLIAVDKYTTGFLHDHIEPAIDYQIPNIAIGNSKNQWFSGNNTYLTYPLIGLYLGSVATNSEKGQVAAANTFKAWVYSYLITHITLKTIFARNRPQRNVNVDEPVREGWTKDPWDFGNFHPIYFKSKHNGTSFPSMHATSYYAMAKVIQMEYDNYWVPYTLATVVFFADLKSHEHWVSDLITAGIVGTIIGKAVVNNSKKQQAKRQNDLVKLQSKKTTLEKQWIPQISGEIVGLKFIGIF